ncbi:MAG: hypothetical protein COV76_07230 [Candidatus Omnitrophica bacterium CG11_big_fil_rev_8_21_14_0_20_64_10]|nr:MAG: hypothetical protein COV76_07230 [Candidatus Omnitrophica bacterium CG11_big_fil_rev_8_21_14_0_20_64_10]
MISKGRGLFLVLILAAPVPAWAGEVRGSVVLPGSRPEPEQITLRAKPGASLEGCGPLERKSQRLRVGAEGGVAEAVIWLESADSETVAQTSASGLPAEGVLDQRTCAFVPHTVILPVGGRLTIRNSDSVLHNVRIFQGAAMQMHEWQKAGARDLTWEFPEAGRYIVRCGVHPWMYAWVAVLAHPHGAISDEEGRFRLPGVRPGRYRLKVWHETLGTVERPIVVPANGLALEPVLMQPEKEA